jgi:hypothetical protein
MGATAVDRLRDFEASVSPSRREQNRTDGRTAPELAPLRPVAR